MLYPPPRQYEGNRKMHLDEEHTVIGRKADRQRAAISDYSGNHTKLSKILLNGNNICMVRDGTPHHFSYLFNPPPPPPPLPPPFGFLGLDYCQLPHVRSPHAAVPAVPSATVPHACGPPLLSSRAARPFRRLYLCWGAGLKVMRGE